jgi:predicted site-specific integrase-resolvase
MLIGYARVSIRDQKAHLQLDALCDAGCEKIFEETVSGARRDRPELNAALDFMRSGDTLVVPYECHQRFEQQENVSSSKKEYPAEICAKKP